MRNTVLSLVCFLFFTLGFAQSNDFLAGKIIVKIKSKYADKCAKSKINISPIQKVISVENIQRTTKIFPTHHPVKSKGLVNLSNLYYFEFDNTVNAKKIIKQLKQLDEVEYAELIPTNYLTFTPSDTLNSQQWYLEAINAHKAWDVQQGDTNVVIAFTDTGTDVDHPDLVGNYAYNYDDPINGIDDDGDGFIDNFLGWDVADNDNNVQAGNSSHGTNVGGLASAATNNTTGISGLGFNTKLLPVKIDQNSTGVLTAAYEGIVYAADQGAFIISNSWGSHSFSQFSQDIINYATLNKGALVIAATGNDGDERRFYPAAYDNVLSVGSMQFNDTVKANSNYGYWADIFAPGEAMITTNSIGGYSFNGGTSMAAPVVAGIAGLVKAQFPSYDWRQVTEQILNNGEDIYAINDAIYTDKLGAGQLDAYRALTDSTQPGIVFIDRTITDGNDNFFAIGDTLAISGHFINVLKSASNVSIELKTIDNRLQVLNGVRLLSTLAGGDSLSLENNPFLVRIPNDIDLNETIEFEINITADAYRKRQFFPLTVNMDFLTINENNLTVTLTSNGSIGFSETNRQLGSGLRHLESNSLLFDGSFMIGTSPNRVASRYRNNNNGSDKDFQTINPIRIHSPQVADFEASSVFDDGEGSAANFRIDENWYVYKQPEAQNSIVYEYIIENISNANLRDIYAGVIIDWDISDFSKNKVGFDPVHKLGVSFSTDTSIYVGTRVLTKNLKYNHYGIDNANNGNGGVNVGDGFSMEEKYTVLSTSRNIAGESTPEGNDILEVTSYGPFNLNAGEKTQLAFSVTISNDLPQLLIESDSVASIYERRVLSVTDLTSDDIETQVNIYPNPVKSQLTASVQLNRADRLQYAIVNGEGKTILESNLQSYSAGNHQIQINTSNLKAGIYFFTLKGENTLANNKFVVVQ